MALVRSVCRPLLRLSRYQQRRNGVSDSGAYDAPGMTVANILNRDSEELLLIDTYSVDGFRLNKGLFVIGPCAVFPRTLFHWDVRDHLDIDIPSLSLFYLLEPKIDILILGVGDKENVKDIDPSIRRFLMKKKISHEILSTGDACGMFNFLNFENRNVACGLIPPDTVVLNTWEEVMADQRMKGTLGVRESTMADVRRLREAKEDKRELELWGRTFQGETVFPRPEERIVESGPLTDGKSSEKEDALPEDKKKAIEGPTKGSEEKKDS